MTFVNQIKQQRDDTMRSIKQTQETCNVIQIYKNDHLKNQALEWLKQYCELCIKDGNIGIRIPFFRDDLKNMPGINDMYIFWKQNLSRHFDEFTDHIQYDYILDGAKYIYFNAELQYLIKSFSNKYSFTNRQEFLFFTCFQKKERAYVKDGTISIMWDFSNYC